jgi:hypothetical protein
MKTLPLCALVLLLSADLSYAADAKSGISISFSSEDSRINLGARHAAGEGRVAITTRDGLVTLFLLNDVVAVQLTDRALAKTSNKPEAGFFEELVVAGVRLALGKAVEFPIANIRSVDLRDGALVLMSDNNQPVFGELKVNGTDVLRDFSDADATRFVNAFRAAKRAQR